MCVGPLIKAVSTSQYLINPDQVLIFSHCGSPKHKVLAKPYPPPFTLCSSPAIPSIEITDRDWDGPNWGDAANHTIVEGGEEGVRAVEEMEMKSEMGVARAICKVMAEKLVRQEIIEQSLGKI